MQKSIGYISRAVDGDTFVATLEGSSEWNQFGEFACAAYWRRSCRLRLIGLDTPELTAKDEEEKARALRAHRFVEQWLEGVRYVIVEYEKLDPYGRILATVYHPLTGKSLNQALLDADLANVYTRSLSDEMREIQPINWSVANPFLWE